MRLFCPIVFSLGALNIVSEHVQLDVVGLWSGCSFRLPSLGGNPEFPNEGHAQGTLSFEQLPFSGVASAGIALTKRC
jgi:hypothetical protein